MTATAKSRALKFKSLVASEAKRVVPPLTKAERQNPMYAEERATLQKEYDVHIHSYEFYLDFGLKSVAIFYAVIGGILSIYFGGSSKVDNNVLVVLLGLPIMMSIILGSTFLWGASKWKKMSEHIQSLADKIEIERPPDIVLLTYLLRIFGALYLLSGGALIWLMVQLK